MTSDITVVIATIPPRAAMLKRALRSVERQTLQPANVIVVEDTDHSGAAATKNAGIRQAETEFVAMLDDDDQFLPVHLERLRTAAAEHDVDVVYSVPVVPQSPAFIQAEPQYFAPFDAAALRERSFIQTTSLVRRELVLKAGGFQCPPGSDYDDWGLWLALLDLGARFHHVPEQTFVWNHWGYGTPGKPGNTSGRADRW